METTQRPYDSSWTRPKLAYSSVDTRSSQGKENIAEPCESCTRCIECIGYPYTDHACEMRIGLRLIHDFFSRRRKGEAGTLPPYGASAALVECRAMTGIPFFGAKHSLSTISC